MESVFSQGVPSPDARSMKLTLLLSTHLLYDASDSHICHLYIKNAYAPHSVWEERFSLAHVCEIEGPREVPLAEALGDSSRGEIHPKYTECI